MHGFASFVSVAGAILLMVKGRDIKLRSNACVVCGQRGQHLIGCPGRRGY